MNEVSPVLDLQVTAFRLTSICLLFLGTYSGVVGGDSEIAKLLSEFGKSESGSNDSDSEGTQVATDEPKEMALANGDVKGRRFSSKLTRRASEVPIDKQKRATLRSLKRSTRPKEHQEKGSVKTHIYRNYLKANGIIGVSPSRYLHASPIHVNCGRKIGGSFHIHDCFATSPGNL